MGISAAMLSVSRLPALGVLRRRRCRRRGRRVENVVARHGMVSCDDSSVVDPVVESNTRQRGC
jgi:hypothetical protein